MVQTLKEVMLTKEVFMVAESPGGSGRCACKVV